MAFALPAGGEDGAELVVGDGAAAGAEGFVFGEVVAGADEGEGWELLGFAASAEGSLVEGGEEIIEDGAVGIEEFVEEDDLGFGEHAIGVGDEFAFFESADVEGAEEFVGFGEAGEEVVKGLADNTIGEGDGAFGRSRRTVEEEVFASDKGDAEEIDDFVFANELLFDGVEQFGFELSDESEV